MTQNELNTFKTFVNSNKYFSNALNNGTIYIDSNIKIELIIYYLTINEKYITESLTPYNKLLHNLITLQNYTINGENIIIEDTIISIYDYVSYNWFICRGWSYITYSFYNILYCYEFAIVYNIN